MSRQINQPINQVKLTNVAVVRCNKDGKRFEIACYRNKVMDYRSGLETDLSEVLQTDRIFTNVSKGQFAKAADLQKAFGTRDQEEIAKFILDQSPKQQSDFQVSDLERAQVIKDTLSQIATWVSQNCVHDDGSDRPFPTGQIKDALGKNYTVHPHKPIKKQCLDAVKFLKSVIPIERAKMELQLQYSLDQQQTVQAALETHTHRMIRKTTSENLCTTVIQVDPSLYRDLSDVMSSVDGTLEILEQVVMSQQGDMDLEQQLEINNRKQQVADQVGVSRDEEDGQDSDVEDLVEKLESIRHTSGADEDDDKHDDKHVSLNGDDDDDDDIYNGSAPSSRKQQKKNRKKSKKQKRREQEEEEERLRIAENEKRRQEERQQKLGQKKTPGEEEQSAAPNITPPRQQEKGQDGAKSCNTCGGAFANAAEYRAHFRSDWHRFNQKLKLKGVTPVSEEEFLLCDADTFFGGV